MPVCGTSRATQSTFRIPKAEDDARYRMQCAFPHARSSLELRTGELRQDASTISPVQIWKFRQRGAATLVSSDCPSRAQHDAMLAG